MARPTNPNNRYSLVCKVTGDSVPTNPKQFNDLMNRYNISAEQLDNSYVSRGGRNIIKSENLTKEQAIEKYGIHQNVADMLKCLAPMTKVNKPRKAKVALLSPEAPESAPEAVEAVEAEEIHAVEDSPESDESSDSVVFLTEDVHDEVTV